MFSEAETDEKMENIVRAADEAFSAFDADLAEDIRIVIDGLEKPDFSAAEKKSFKAIAMRVKKNLDKPRSYADADIEAVIRALLTRP